jgi:hypothetical protein
VDVSTTVVSTGLLGKQCKDHTQMGNRNTMCFKQAAHHHLWNVGQELFSLYPIAT